MNAYWIAPHDVANRKNCYFRARKSFGLKSVPKSATLHIAAESYYMLWVNGHLLGSGPARGSRRLNFYDSYEAASYLRPGHNMIAVLVQNMNIPNFTTFPCRPGVIVELEGVVSSDESWEVLINNEWRENVDLFCVQTGFIEYRNLQLTPDGWQSGKDKAAWTEPEVIGTAAAMDGKQLLPRSVAMLKTREYPPLEIAASALVAPLADSDKIPVAKAVSNQKHHKHGCFQQLCEPLLSAGRHDIEIAAPPDGSDVSVIFNFDREIIGFFELEISAPEGLIVDLGYDEELAAGRLKTDRDHYLMADRYLTRDGQQTIGNTIHERGFRYVEVVIRNLNAPVVLHSVRALDRRYPYVRRGSFNCSDFRLNRIWDICVETMSACTTDVFTDCPWRERAFWVNDLMIENIVALQAFGDSRVNIHALRLAMSNAREDGWIPGVCPDNGKDILVLPATNLFVILMLKDYYIYTGDEELVNELLPQMLDLLELFAGLRNKDGLVVPPKKFWNFFDWSYERNKIMMNGYNTSLLNWLYCWAIGTAAELLAIKGGAAAGKEYRQQAASLACAIDRHFWVEKKQCYADWLKADGTPSHESSQLTHAFALLSGRLPEKRRKAAVEALSNPVFRMPELYLHHFVFAAMKVHGLNNEALARIGKYWGKVAASGSPTLWETAIHEEGKRGFGGVGSLCHGFGCTPIDYFQTVILGVTPLEPGFKRFAVAPVPHDLDFAEGRIPTPHGSINVRWEKINDASLNVTFTVPRGTHAVYMGNNYKHGKHNIVVRKDESLILTGV